MHARVVVVFGQALDVVLERIQAARGEDARLAQRAAQHLLPAPRLADQLARAGEHRAHRRAEALREVDPGGVEAAGAVARGHAGREDGVEQPRAVEVRPQAVSPGGLEHLEDRPARPHPAAAEIGGLLDRDRARARRVPIPRRADRRLELCGRDDASRGRVCVSL
ncbi:MAG TPA: hypothetical protein VMF09_13705 [Solirubrobacteraceae bacterium]|nr:hypothetical protein [Solirubrobacteraceae bacterium]